MSEHRNYETTLIVNAALEDNDVETVITKVTTYIENHGGNILEIERWGRRRLAYPINKKFNGYYVHIVFNANSSTVPILERFLVLEDTVLRHLTLVLSDKLRDYRANKSLALAQEKSSSENKIKEEVDSKVEPEENTTSKPEHKENAKAESKEEIAVND